jgi:hypothetical protein
MDDDDTASLATRRLISMHLKSAPLAAMAASLNNDQAGVKPQDGVNRGL